MELRHFRYFIAVAEELHFSRAAERLNIEQSPLSRTIKDLESKLGARLFDRTPRGARLTWAGQVFLEDAYRIMQYVDQAKLNAKAAVAGYRGALRIALCDGIPRSHLATLLTWCREEEPEVEIRLSEVSLSDQLKGLRDGLYDACFSLTDEAQPGIVAEPIWHDPLVIILPSRHPLLVYKDVPLQEAVNYPVVLCDLQICAGCVPQLDKVRRANSSQCVITERATSHELMLTLVAAGYGVGLTSAAHVKFSQHNDIVVRPVTGHSLMFITYLLRPDTGLSEQLRNFILRAKQINT